VRRLRARANLASRVLLWGIALSGAGCKEREPEVARDLDLERFQGRWYEIARIPRDHDRLCHDTVAEYRLNAPGKLELFHHCRLGSERGPVSEFRAPATVEDPGVPAKLTLQIGLYRGDYWVLEVGPNYEYALIGHPSLTMLWVLSRKPSLAADVWTRLQQRAQRDGFGLELLQQTPQSEVEHP
jgi:apolipoprotein D and lipocalin family protein